MHMHTSSSGALSEECHLVGVTSEILDFLLHPLESQSLVFQSRVSRGVGSSQSEKSWTKCIVYIVERRTDVLSQLKAGGDRTNPQVLLELSLIRVLLFPLPTQQLRILTII